MGNEKAMSGKNLNGTSFLSETKTRSKLICCNKPQYLIKWTVYKSANFLTWFLHLYHFIECF